jgi:hypothetical protein
MGIFLVGASLAQADPTITYGFVDYPDYQPDTGFSSVPTGRGNWHVSGTIVTDGTLGTLTAGNIEGGSVVLTGPDESFAFPVVIPASDPEFRLDATDSTLSVPPETIVYIGDGTGPTGWLQYENEAIAPDIQGGRIVSGVYHCFYFWNPAIPGTAADPSSWVIATVVPEPATLTLLISAVLGLASAVYLRRRGAIA